MVGTPGPVPDRATHIAPARNGARERVLAALDELGVRTGDVFAMRDVYGQLGIFTGTREHGAVQRAIDRMYRGDRGRAPELERVWVGWYRRR